MEAGKIPNANLRRGGGRPKGSQNKTTRAAKDMIAEVAEGLGGPKRMLAWAKEAPENEKAFWTQVYPKLLPVQIANEEGKAFIINAIIGGDAPARD
jgi:hypothetical protein